MNEAINNASDWVAAYLPTIIAIVTSSTFVFIVMRFILNLILLKVKNKTTKNLNDDVIKKYTELENRVNRVVEDMEKLFTASMEKYSEMTKKQFSKLMAQYQNMKKEYFNAVIDGKEDLVALVDDVKTLKDNVEKKLENLPDEVQLTIEPKVEEIKIEAEEAVSNLIEVPQEKIEEIKEEIEEIKEEVKDDGYVVVKKVYGE